MEPKGADKGKEKDTGDGGRGHQHHEQQHDEIHPLFDTWICPFNAYLTRTRPTKTISPARHRGEECKADKNGSCCVGRACLCFRQHAECGQGCPCKCSERAMCGNQQLRRAEGKGVVHTPIERDLSKRHIRLLVDAPVKSGQLLSVLMRGPKIIEMTGIVMETEQMKPWEPELGEYHVMHCYQHRDLCFDMRAFSNLAKYIRCVCQACRPSARVVEVYVDGDLRLGVFARQDLKQGDEVTIPFDRDPSPAHIVRCPELIPNACLFRSQERTQRFTNHAYVEPKQFDFNRFMIKLMAVDPKAFLKLEKQLCLSRTVHFKLLQPAVPSAGAKKTKRTRPRRDVNEERLALERAEATLKSIDRDLDAPAAAAAGLDLNSGVMEIVADHDFGASQGGGGEWETLTDAQRDMLPMAFPEAINRAPLPIAEEQAITTIPEPPTFTQDCLLLEEIWHWQHTNCAQIKYAAEWDKMIKRHTKRNSTNLNISLQWASYNDKKDKQTIPPRSFGSQSRLLVLASQLSHLMLIPCQCQFSAAAFQGFASCTNLR